LIPPRNERGARLHPHAGSRVLAAVERSFLIKLRRLAPCRHVTRPTVETNAAGSVCGIRRAGAAEVTAPSLILVFAFFAFFFRLIVRLFVIITCFPKLVS